MNKKDQLNLEGLSKKKPIAYFVQIPNEAINDKDLSNSAFRLLCRIKQDKLTSFSPSYKLLMEWLGWNRSTVQRAIRELEELGYLVRLNSQFDFLKLELSDRALVQDEGFETNKGEE